MKTLFTMILFLILIGGFIAIFNQSTQFLNPPVVNNPTITGTPYSISTQNNQYSVKQNQTIIDQFCSITLFGKPIAGFCYIINPTLSTSGTIGNPNQLQETLTYSIGIMAVFIGLGILAGIMGAGLLANVIASAGIGLSMIVFIQNQMSGLGTIPLPIAIVFYAVEGLILFFIIRDALSSGGAKG